MSIARSESRSRNHRGPAATAGLLAAGALTMVKDLFATPGAAQESEMFAFASDVDSDQRMEIDRMNAMLKEFKK